jgi:hypothetical protein
MNKEMKSLIVPYPKITTITKIKIILLNARVRFSRSQLMKIKEALRHEIRNTCLLSTFFSSKMYQPHTSVNLNHLSTPTTLHYY